MSSVPRTRRYPVVPASQATRNTVLEATVFGVASRILIGSECTAPCFIAIIHGTDGAYMGQPVGGRNRDGTTAEVKGAGTTVGALTGDSSGG